MRYDRRADIHEAFLSLGARDLLAVAAKDVDAEDGLKTPEAPTQKRKALRRLPLLIRCSFVLSPISHVGQGFSPANRARKQA